MTDGFRAIDLLNTQPYMEMTTITSTDIKLTNSCKCGAKKILVWKLESHGRIIYFLVWQYYLFFGTEDGILRRIIHKDGRQNITVELYIKTRRIQETEKCCREKLGERSGDGE